MVFARSRRDFLKQGSLLAALSSGMLELEPAWAQTATQTRFVEADTAFGRVRGADVEGIKTFKGIPYGASTAGRNRFMPPVDPAKWSGVRDALAYGPSAPQREPGVQREESRLAVAAAGLPGEGEDCLVLNVWTPGLADGGRRPVMFYIHGGGFTSGSGGLPFDGDPMVRLGDVVVVTVNHRLGPLGYLNLEGAGWPEEFRYASVAGMMDLVAALEWVRDNIESFGGDPGNVMIYGQSGGGSKTSHLMGMPSGKGLFHRAAVQSGSRLEAGSEEQAAASASRLVEELGVTSGRPEEIQDIDWAAIIEAEANSGFGPILHEEVIPHHPFDPTAPEESRDVPLLLGYAREDSGYRGPSGPVTSADLQEWAEEAYDESAPEILSLYSRVYPNATPSQIRARISTDSGVRRRAEMMAERKADQGGAPAYMYLVEWPSPSFEGKFGAVHGVDLGLVLADPRIPISGNTPGARRMADVMGSAFATFARTGDPNCDLVPHWSPYDRASRTTMVLDEECRSVDDPTGELRAYWEGSDT